jgi:hypothetical protein
MADDVTNFSPELKIKSEKKVRITSFPCLQVLESHCNLHLQRCQLLCPLNEQVLLEEIL